MEKEMLLDDFFFFFILSLTGSLYKDEWSHSLKMAHVLSRV